MTPVLHDSDVSPSHPQKWIIHIDMDAFYASIEQADFPELKDRPVVVGMGKRGVVAAASYEARAFGVRSAMPLGEALQRCPSAIFQPVRMARYREISATIMQGLRTMAPCIEVASIDEAYIDATGFKHLYPSVNAMTLDIQQQVGALSNGLSCSLGVAPIKFMAKIASDMNKPHGITIITHEALPEVLRVLPVAKIPGVGKKSLQNLKNLGIQTCGDVYKYPADFFERHFGKMGILLYERAHGIDARLVEPEQRPKSCSAEITFLTDTKDTNILEETLYTQATRVGQALRHDHLQGDTISIKIKFADFTQITRQCHLSHPTCATETIFEHAQNLLKATHLRLPVRLIGLGVSGFEHTKKHEQGSLFADVKQDKQLEREAHRTRVDKLIDTMQSKFTDNALKRGRSL